MHVRVRRVMEYRWVRESMAKKLIAESDSQPPQLLRELLRGRLVQPLGIPPHGQQRPAGSRGGGSARAGRRRHWSRGIARESHVPLAIVYGSDVD